MQINFIDDLDVINKLEIKWNYSQSEIYQALEQEEFQDNSNYSGRRLWCSYPKNPILIDILDSLYKNAPMLLGKMCEQKDFKEDFWRLQSTEQMLRNASATCSFLCDKPGFTTTPHVDCRTTLCTGMFFFNQVDDEEQSTFFYLDKDGNNKIRMSSQYGTGWYAANFDLPHLGMNNSQRDRYTLILTHYLELK